jgi:hypothetical protein
MSELQEPVIGAATSDLGSVALDELAREIHDAEEALAFSKATLEQLHGELVRRFGVHAEEAYTAAGKQGGRITVAAPGSNRYRLALSRSKTVKYDADKLFAAARNMDWQAARHWFDFDISMSEKKFDALQPGSELHKAVSDARAVKYGATKIALIDATEGESQ